MEDDDEIDEIVEFCDRIEEVNVAVDFHDGQLLGMVDGEKEEVKSELNRFFDEFNRLARCSFG